MLKRTRNAMLLALLSSIGCGSDVLNSSGSPDLSAMPLVLTLDVGDNLVRHFSQQSPKPAVDRPLPKRTYHFDFVERGRTLSPEGNGIISGDFLFSINNQPSQRGSIEIVYAPDGAVWQRTRDVRILQKEIEAVTLVAEIRDSESGQPLADAAVEARPADGVRTSRTVRTDASGRAEVEVLAGEFELTVEHPRFQTTFVAAVNANGTRVFLDGITLAPVKKLFRTE
ncbi:MAG: carboxypeptidase-like regulatory domain-containing protein [bacterium]|nr:carboxypeptidase-like regulatory domain-containing protein [bacterium]